MKMKMLVTDIPERQWTGVKRTLKIWVASTTGVPIQGLGLSG